MMAYQHFGVRLQLLKSLFNPYQARNSLMGSEQASFYEHYCKIVCLNSGNLQIGRKLDWVLNLPKWVNNPELINLIYFFAMKLEINLIKKNVSPQHLLECYLGNWANCSQDRIVLFSKNTNFRIFSIYIVLTD